MRTKSLPLSVRTRPQGPSTPGKPVHPSSAPARRGRRPLDLIATLLMVALLPALVLPQSNVDASLVPPTIVGRTVGAQAGGISILAVIAARFDRPVVGVSNKSFRLLDPQGRVVPAIVRYDAVRYRVELLPLDALRADRRYEVSLSTAIRTSAGVAVTEEGWAFRTLRQPSSATRYLPPRAVRFAPGRVKGIQVDGSGRVISSLTGRLANHSWATADAKAKIKGRSYYSIIDGKWAGYFVPAAAIVDVESRESSPEPAPTLTAPAEPSSGPSTSIGPSPSPQPAQPAPDAPTPAPTAKPPVVQQPSAGDYIIMSASELRALPTSGAAWDALKRTADAPAGQPNLADLNQATNVNVLAKALVYARTGTETYRSAVVGAVRSVMGTEAAAETLAVGRELAAYVIAADLIGLSSADPSLDASFRSWLQALLDRRLLDGKSLTETHERRPNNWGTHAGASRAAAAAYLGDNAEISRVATVFRGWLGDRTAYSGFRYGDLWWQSNPAQPLGINPPGATIGGRSVDGVLPDDQRRTGEFTWPPPCGNYPHGALDGALLTAEILYRAGHAAYSWGSQAILRAETWLQATGCAPSGDNVWQLPLLDARYGTHFWNGATVRPGKNFGWTDWLYGN